MHPWDWLGYLLSANHIFSSKIPSVVLENWGYSCSIHASLIPLHSESYSWERICPVDSSTLALLLPSLSSCNSQSLKVYRSHLRIVLGHPTASCSCTGSSSKSGWSRGETGHSWGISAFPAQFYVALHPQRLKTSKDHWIQHLMEHSLMATLGFQQKLGFWRYVLVSR